MEELSIWLEDQNGGMRTYLEFQQKVSILSKRDASNSALYALMGLVAQRFYQAYDGEPLPVDAANEALARLRAVVADARQAMQASAQDQLRLLNELAGLELVARRIYSMQ
jgi:hypothetical protein